MSRLVDLTPLPYLKLAETAASMRNVLKRNELGDHLSSAGTKSRLVLFCCRALIFVHETNLQYFKEKKKKKYLFAEKNRKAFHPRS